MKSLLPIALCLLPMMAAPQPVGGGNRTVIRHRRRGAGHVAKFFRQVFNP